MVNPPFRFETLCVHPGQEEPDPSYRGLRYAHDLGRMNLVAFACSLTWPMQEMPKSISSS